MDGKIRRSADFCERSIALSILLMCFDAWSEGLPLRGVKSSFKEEWDLNPRSGNRSILGEEKPIFFCTSTFFGSRLRSQPRTKELRGFKVPLLSFVQLDSAG